MINASDSGTGVLFAVADGELRADGPAMTGRLEVRPAQTGRAAEVDANHSVPLAAFLKHAKATGQPYLVLKVGREHDKHVYGKLFALSKQTKAASLRAPDYTGFLEFTADGQRAQTKVTGWRRRFTREPGREFISLTFAPVEVIDGNAECRSPLPI